VSVVTCAPHDPDGSTSCSTSEGEKLYRSVTLESAEGNNSVLDGRSSSGTDGKRTSHLEYQTQDLFAKNQHLRLSMLFRKTYHSLAVCNRTGGNASCPSVGNIVGTIVVRFKKRKECANGKDIGVLVKNRHLD
jgi:hypothetical protein